MLYSSTFFSHFMVQTPGFTDMISKLLTEFLLTPHILILYNKRYAIIYYQYYKWQNFYTFSSEIPVASASFAHKSAALPCLGTANLYCKEERIRVNIMYALKCEWMNIYLANKIRIEGQNKLFALQWIGEFRSDQIMCNNISEFIFVIGCENIDQ